MPQPAAQAEVARVRSKNLLDEALDPDEFPQTIPPPPPSDEPEEGFELLVDDDEILDIDDAELEDAQDDYADEEGEPE